MAGVSDTSMLKGGSPRPLSGVLLQYTLAITLGLGLMASGVTLWVDLQREKNAIERLAHDFMSSAAPSAAAAAYNYDDAAAQQVAAGLLMERSITSIVILNEGDRMVDESREVSPTLPRFGPFGASDEVVLTRMLYAPGASAASEPIGIFSITVDKSLVAPEIVDRLLTAVLITTAKNMVYGLILFWFVFNVLARHILELTRLTQQWQPGAQAMKPPSVPPLLERTEVEGLGHRIEQLTDLANGALELITRSHNKVLDTNAELYHEVRDRTRELEQVNARLQYMADRDGLTGLYNRAFFDRTLSEAFQQPPDKREMLAVLLIDVDHFKAYNDFYGHQAGDEALVCLAGILKQVHDETGCLVARYGGEEFVALLQSPAPEPARLADRIHHALKQAAVEHQHSTVARRITVSIGTASTEEPEFFQTPDRLVSAADDALYEAKNAGRNRTVASTPDIRAQARAQRLSVRALLQAIEAREFDPFLQPQVDARTGALVGAEALVRWVRADGTTIAPGSFMATAEKTGLIKKIDIIVLEKLQDFVSAHPTVLPRLSINVLAENFANEAYVEALLRLAGTSDTRITVELLETAFVDRPDDQLLWQLDRLREAGIDIEIDDFGTGRTSILGLMAISPDRLKIARELILPLEHGAGQVKLVTSVVEIARSLEMNVLAEGVESAEIARMLIDIGCPIQQGFLHGKPMPLQDMLERHGTSDPSTRRAGF
jgi:diguanylate cyclase (GGDEF)-like protein